jgi:hypothetical protein
MKSWRFPSRCPTRKRQRKRPVRAMAYFFAMEDFKIPEELIAWGISRFLKNTPPQSGRQAEPF